MARKNESTIDEVARHSVRLTLTNLKLKAIMDSKADLTLDHLWRLIEKVQDEINEELK